MRLYSIYTIIKSSPNNRTGLLAESVQWSYTIRKHLKWIKRESGMVQKEPICNWSYAEMKYRNRSKVFQRDPIHLYRAVIRIQNNIQGTPRYINNRKMIRTLSCKSPGINGRSFHNDTCVSTGATIGIASGADKDRKDFRRFTLRSGCAPHCWPCQLYAAKLRDATYVETMDAYTYTMGGCIGKLSCQPQLDYGALCTHTPTHHRTG